MEESLASRFLSQLRQQPVKSILAELLATFVLVVIGDGVVAVITLRRLDAESVVVGAFGWGLAVTIAITVAGGVSGGHCNPAATLAFASAKKCPWRYVLPYMAAQYIGGFLASAAVYLVYADAIHDFDGGKRMIPPEHNSTAQIFATYPQDFASALTCFWDQIVGTGLLLITASAVTDEKNMKVPPFAQPLLIGLGLTTIILSFGYNCMAPLNPARDLSPRIFTAMFGWSSDVFKFRNYNWFWVPIIGPHIGALIGVWIYRLIVELHHDEFTKFENSDSKDSFPISAFSKDVDTNKEENEKVAIAMPHRST